MDADDDLEVNEEVVVKPVPQPQKPKPPKSSGGDEEEEESGDESDSDDEDDKKKKKKKSCWYNIPYYHRFTQQTLPYKIIILTPFPFVMCLLFFFVVLGIIGIAFLVSASYIVETPAYRYDNLCHTGSTCTFRFEVEEDMDKPVYLYYRLEQYFQNHRRYKNSVSYSQLRGKDVNNYDSLSPCTPKISYHDDHDSDKVYLPCGLQGVSFFNDTFELTYENDIRVPHQTSDDVSFPSDDTLFKDPGTSTKGIRVADSFENPLLQVWMRIAALPNFLKLYSIIDEDLKKGTYKMKITNYYPVHDYDALKFFKLSTCTWNGGRNFYLGIALVAVSLICLALAIFVFLKDLFWPRKLGNIAYLDWDHPN